jgi:hypothetical protein
MASEPPSLEQWRWERVAAELRAQRAAQRAAWGDLENATLSRYLAGKATVEERGRVEAALREHPELARLMHLVGGVLGDFLPSEPEAWVLGAGPDDMQEFSELAPPEAPEAPPTRYRV